MTVVPFPDHDDAAWVEGHFHCVACNHVYEGGGYSPVGCPMCGDDMVRLTSLDDVLNDLGITRAELEAIPDDD